MSDEPVVHEVEQQIEPKAPVAEPLVEGDCKLHDHKPEEVKIQSQPEAKAEEVKAEAPPPITPKKIMRPWYEMLDTRK